MLCTLAGLVAGLTNGSFAVLLTDLFPTRIRFTGVALVFNVSFTIFSGTAPLVATSADQGTGQRDVARLHDDGERRRLRCSAACGSSVTAATSYRAADPNSSNEPCCGVSDFSLDANATSFMVL